MEGKLSEAEVLDRDGKAAAGGTHGRLASMGAASTTTDEGDSAGLTSVSPAGSLPGRQGDASPLQHADNRVIEIVEVARAKDTGHRLLGFRRQSSSFLVRYVVRGSLLGTTAPGRIV
jgi:hypothetical protein